MDRPVGRLADVAAWLGCLALVGFACDPDTLWFPVRFAGWASEFLLA